MSTDAFWRENAEKLVENNCQLLRVLLKLLETSRDSTTLAVGCLDVAQFVSHVSHGARSGPRSRLHRTFTWALSPASPRSSALRPCLCSRPHKWSPLPAAGRGIVTELRGKELVMRLMMHPDPDVQSQALKCVQKVLLSRDKADFLSV